MTNQNPYDQLGSELLTELGFNLQAVFSVKQLPASFVRTLPWETTKQTTGSCSVLVLGHGGKRFWQEYQKQQRFTPEQSNNPIDEYSAEIAGRFMAEKWPDLRYHVLYPGPHPVGLQQLGKMAGWHHESPLKVGINDYWGFWYAYRVVLLVEGELPLTRKVQSANPCNSCEEKPCLTACPSGALQPQNDYLETCVKHRLETDSSCQFTCLARQACPVQSQHQYSSTQIQYHYQCSYNTLQRYYRK